MHVSFRNLATSVCFWAICTWLLLIGLTNFSSVASAQPETFEGNPDSNAFIWIPSNTDDWTRHFRIGALVGMNISANFSRSGTFGISGNNPAQGIYDDGYVRVDNAGDPLGHTYYWGYNNPSQLNGTTLSMHAASSFSTAGSGEESGVFPGFEMAYGDNLWYWKHARVGWELGFGLLPIQISDSQSMSATVSQTTYNFDVSNPYGAPLPGSGSGTPYQGGPNGPGYQIPDQPASVVSTNVAGTVTGKQTLDVMLYTLRLGPTFYWDLTEHVGMSLGAGPALGIVSGDYKYDETITAGAVSAHNEGRFGATDLVYGGYVNATVMYHAVANGDIYAGVQYMPMTDATFSNAGRDGRLNLNGQVYFTIGINWPF